VEEGQGESVTEVIGSGAAAAVIDEIAQSGDVVSEQVDSAPTPLPSEPAVPAEPAAPAETAVSTETTGLVADEESEFTAGAAAALEGETPSIDRENPVQDPAQVPAAESSFAGSWSIVPYPSNVEHSWRPKQAAIAGCGMAPPVIQAAEAAEVESARTSAAAASSSWFSGRAFTWPSLFTGPAVEKPAAERSGSSGFLASLFSKRSTVSVAEAASPNEPAAGEPATAEDAAEEPAAGEAASGEPATGVDTGSVEDGIASSEGGQPPVSGAAARVERAGFDIAGSLTPEPEFIDFSQPSGSRTTRRRISGVDVYLSPDMREVRDGRLGVWMDEQAHTVYRVN